MSTAVERLWPDLQTFTDYPAGVLAVPERIKGTSFFPGGDGLYKENGELPFPFGKVMILGHDFHSEHEYNASLKRTHEDLAAPTWRNLLLLLAETGIAPEDCFYTNFFMGLREGKATTGVFPGKKNKNFVQRCREFFLFQLEVVRPKVILVLGTHVPSLVAPLSDQLKAWEKSGLKDIDVNCAALVRDVIFRKDLPPTTLVALTHPCLRHSNVGRRAREGRSGHEVEVGMIKEACELKWELV